MLGTSLTPSTAKANDCDQVIKDCNKALKAADDALAEKSKLILFYQDGLSHATDTITDLNRQVDEKNHALEAWYRNPFIDVGIGVAVGAIGVLLLKK